MKPSSQHLTHDFPFWRGVTIWELLKILAGGLLASGVVGIVLGALVGQKMEGVAICMVIGMAYCGFFGPQKYGKLKEGKPVGYMVKHIRIFIENKINMKKTYTYYSGPWKDSKRVK